MREPSRPSFLALRCVGLFVVYACVFVFSSVRYEWDAKYTLLVSHSLLHHGSFSLTRYFDAPGADRQASTAAEAGDGGLPYHVYRDGGEIYYYFPLGTPVLCVPYVAVLEGVGCDVVDADGHYRTGAAGQYQEILASALMAGVGVWLYLLALRFLGNWWSGALASVVMFASPIWSVASRTMWSHTLLVFLYTWVIWLLVGQETGRKERPALLATLLAWAYFVRPTAAVGVVAVTVYLLVRRRRMLPVYLATGVAWAGLGMSCSWTQLGRLLPPYYHAGRVGSLSVFPEALAGNLISPARGLLVYCPALIVVAWLLVARRRHVPLRGLAILAMCLVTAHLLVISSFGHWWGGHCFGPRFLTDMVPWLALLAILSVHAWQQGRGAGDAGDQDAPRPGLRLREWIARGLAIVLVAISMGMHALGTTSSRAHLWNAIPDNIDTNPKRVWDWSDPPFLRPFRPRPPLPAAFSPKKARRPAKRATLSRPARPAPPAGT